MATSMFVFADVDAKTAKPANVLAEIRQILINDENAWASIERYIRPPGVCGSRQFDQCMAVQELMAADAKRNKYVAVYKDEHRATERDLWSLLQRVIRNSGFDIRNGRLLGIKESHEDASESGELDLE